MHHHIGDFVMFLAVKLYDKILTQFQNNYKPKVKTPELFFTLNYLPLQCRIFSVYHFKPIAFFSTRHFAKLQHLVLLAPVSPNSSDLHSFLPGHLPQNLQQLGNYFEQLGNNFEQPGDNIEKIGNDNFFYH